MYFDAPMFGFYFTLFKIYIPGLNRVFVYAVINDYDYVFSENGLVAHKEGKLIGTQVLHHINPENEARGNAYITA